MEALRLILHRGIGAAGSFSSSRSPGRWSRSADNEAERQAAVELIVQLGQAMDALDDRSAAAFVSPPGSRRMAIRRRRCEARARSAGEFAQVTAGNWSPAAAFMAVVASAQEARSDRR